MPRKFFGDFLKKARIQLDNSQSEIAKFLGRSGAWVNRIENESIPIPADRELLAKMALVYDVDLSELELRAGLIPGEYLSIVGGFPDGAIVMLDALVGIVQANENVAKED